MSPAVKRSQAEVGARTVTRTSAGASPTTSKPSIGPV
jgi:hypothetical protein